MNRVDPASTFVSHFCQTDHRAAVPLDRRHRADGLLPDPWAGAERVTFLPRGWGWALVTVLSGAALLVAGLLCL